MKESSDSLLCQEDEIAISPEKPKIQLPSYYVEQEKHVLETFNAFMKKSIELIAKSTYSLNNAAYIFVDDKMQIDSTNSNTNLQPLLSPRLSKEQTPTSPTFATPQIKAAKRTLFPTTNIIATNSVTHTINIGSNAREDNAPSVS